MPTLTVYVGLPGSGKSWHAGRFAAEQGIDNIEDVFHPRQKDPEKTIAELLSQGDCVIDSTALIHPTARARFQRELEKLVPDVLFRWEFMKNEPTVCIKNIIHDFEKGDRDDWMERIQAVLKTTAQYKGFDEGDAISVHRAYEPQE